MSANSFFKGIDLSSDTATLPTKAMKKAAMMAPLGDEQKGEDPTTRYLEEVAAHLLGLDHALFLPSATMSNQIAIRLLCEPGEELIAAENSHLLSAESGGSAIFSGVMARPIKTSTGIFTGKDIQTSYRKSNSSRHTYSKCVSVENTTNIGGGLAWDLDILNTALSIAKALELKTHLDGARLFNAAIKTNLSVRSIASSFDTVTLCLSKGLGCPMGAILAFKKIYYDKAKRLKHLFGGALRQSGIIAAMGLYALEHHIQRLAEDHQHAAYLASKLSEIDGIHVETHPAMTNMVFFKLLGKHLSAKEFHNLCVQKGLRFHLIGTNRLRAVTHLNIQREHIDKAIHIVQSIQLATKSAI